MAQVSRTLANVCSAVPGMSEQRLIEIGVFLKNQTLLDKQMSPGVTSFLTWLGVSGLFWGGAGWWIRHSYPALGDDDPTGHRSIAICVAMIIYFSLCIFIILIYAWLIRKFRERGWDSLHPGESYSGPNPTLTWGIMGLFSIGGLFVSIILLCHYSGHDLHPALIVLLSLLALILSTTVALVGKVFVNCIQPNVKFSVAEANCVKEYLQTKKMEELAAAEQIILAGQVAESRKKELEGITPEKLVELTSGGQGIGVEGSRKETAAAQALAQSQAQSQAQASQAQAVSRNLIQALLSK